MNLQILAHIFFTVDLLDLLTDGAELKSIQKLLGHKGLSFTQAIYKNKHR
jgi:site-specific recombinase XerD